MFPVLIFPQIFVCVHVCPAFPDCGSAISGNRGFGNNQLNKASGGPHSGALHCYSCHRSPTWKHISSKYLPQATVGGAAIENRFRSVSLRPGNKTDQSSQLGPPNHALSHFLKVLKNFLPLKSIYLCFVNCFDGRNSQMYYTYYLYLVW